jgi:Ca-activated chloride channel homolog
MIRKFHTIHIVVVLLALVLIGASFAPAERGFAQAGRQKSSDKQKKNPGATGDPEQDRKEQERQIDRQVDKSQAPATIAIGTDIVNVEAVVYNKKTGGVIQNLKKEHFEIYEDGVKQEIENFANPEAPVTMVMLLEYSKLLDRISPNPFFEPGRVEVLRPAYEFVNRFVQPRDFISIVAYDIRPTPIVDFTDDRNKLAAAVNLLIRNNPAFSESNLFDSLKFVLRGGKGDAVVLEENKDKAETADYAGLYEVNARTAILLVSTGIDTFSKINYDEARKIVENSGVPVYIIGVGNLFLKKYDNSAMLDPSGPGQLIYGIPDRMTFLQAQNTLKTFADSTGGKYYPVTFPGEIPSVLQSISALVRNEYSLGYTSGNTRKEGKRRKIQVKVNLGDQIDPKLIVVQHRQSYVEPKGDKKY